jgi:hypothetical protein
MQNNITQYLPHLLHNLNHTGITKSKGISEAASNIILLTSSFLRPSCLP